MSIRQIFLAFSLLVLMAGRIDAALMGRLPLTPGGTDHQAYYDTVLDITWLANANAAAGTIYDDGLRNWDGKMTWAAGVAWIASLNTASHLGVSDWRLPIILDTGPRGCDFSFSGGTDCGYNVQTINGAEVYSELGHLFHETLGNLSYYDTSGNPNQPGWGLQNTSPFTNVQHNYYWSSTEYVRDSRQVWYFDYFHGFQSVRYKTDDQVYTWAVRDGDIGLAVVPVPGAVWLLGSALGIAAALRRPGIASEH